MTIRSSLACTHKSWSTPQHFSGRKFMRTDGQDSNRPHAGIHEGMDVSESHYTLRGSLFVVRASSATTRSAQNHTLPSSGLPAQTPHSHPKCHVRMRSSIIGVGVCESPISGKQMGKNGSRALGKALTGLFCERFDENNSSDTTSLLFCLFDLTPTG